MKLTCSYCGKEFERESMFKNNFCKSSHRVNFSRNGALLKKYTDIAEKLVGKPPKLYVRPRPSMEELKAIVNPLAPKNTVSFIKEDKFKENKERKIVSSWSA